MSKLQDLIQKLCPEGVEFKRLGEVCEIYTGGEPPKDTIKGNAKDVEHPYPVWANGKDVYGYSSTYKINKDATVISSIGANTGAIYFRRAYFTPTIRLKVLVPKDNNLISKYLYYYLSTVAFVVKSSSVPNMNANEVRKLEIPLPPLEVQNEIVRILDAFTSYAAELQAELQARKEQYEYYRNKLLTFDENDESVKWMTLGEVSVNVCSGGTPSTSNKKYYHGHIPWLRTQEVDWKDVIDTKIKISEDAIKNSSAKIIPPNCVIVAMYGATAGKTCINKIPLTTNQACCNLEINKNIALYKYVYYWLYKEYYKLKALGEGSQSNISGKKIKSYVIPIPPLSEQQRIVSILDKFESLVNDLSEGLPAEIAAVQEQYEYYRNKLLTFKRKS